MTGMHSALSATPAARSGMKTSSTGESGRLEWLLRAFAVLVVAAAAYSFASAWWADRSRVTLLLLLVAETYTLALVVLARRAQVRDLSPLAVGATIYVMYAFALIEPRGTTRLISEMAGTVTLVAGTLVQLAAKATLGRAFGVLPANRGVVISGPYRLVRHPIYMGYLINHVGFLLVNFSWRNALVLGLLYVAQLIRIAREEAVLAESDPDYRHYRRRVRWRLVPFIY
jgi:protein-S-isoprenylcysteine O-methyltransferase Ste14